MPKYVDCEVVKDKLSRTLCLYEDLPALIDSIPAADVRPAARGRWEYNSGDNIPYCSECMMPQDSECNFCPNCGADMREAPKEET